MEGYPVVLRSSQNSVNLDILLQHDMKTGIDSSHSPQLFKRGSFHLTEEKSLLNSQITDLKILNV
jgi:hypothetical protein